MARKAETKQATAKPASKPKRASRKTAPSPETLTELGLERLIRLVLDETGRNPAFRKLVTAAVAGLQGPDAVAALIDRRLTALERASGYIDWQKRRAFAADLDATLTTVVAELAPLDARAGLDRLLRFLAAAPGVLARVDDSSGQVHGVFDRAAEAAATLGKGLAPAEAAAFAERLVPMLAADEHGLVEDLLYALIPDLPEAALASLDSGLAAALPPRPVKAGGAQAWALQLERRRTLRLRQMLADRRGDVDAFIALEREAAPEHPERTAIAERLLGAGRLDEALDWVRRPQKRGLVVVNREQIVTGQFDPEAPDRARIDLEIRLLDALGRGSEAQGLRWGQFVRSLDAGMLRAHLAKLPDFEDEDALERAFAHAAAHPDPYRALHFFTHWPKPDRAARLVAEHTWDGGRYEILVPAAEVLEASEPLAAARLYRLLVDDILERGRSAAYGHGARHLSTLEALDARLDPGALVPDHTEYRAGLRKAHGRKAAFWSQVRE
ncbi:hypothetical protein FV218_11315 [Methylobacterium sp. WL69]|uniref:DUF6880 family protein n=1 Tax=Methylobacterium sp. WL69 TaxID=2603893 RepID=UPI0011CBCDB9|nr:DUF6880 family protein [Methylobacterium sp. WL69]TXM73455.1 hypothetical protein FV218_11315 [Methylobacterium sp. WL69]